MTPEEAIQLFREHDQNCVQLVHTVNSTRGIKSAEDKYRKTAKKVLTAMLGRAPTDQELEEATKG